MFPQPELGGLKIDEPLKRDNPEVVVLTTGAIVWGGTGASLANFLFKR